MITGHDEDKAKLKSLNETVAKLKGDKFKYFRMPIKVFINYSLNLLLAIMNIEKH